MSAPPGTHAPIDAMRGSAEAQAMLVELTRVKALFQARALAAALGAPMPDPADFRRSA